MSDITVKIVGDASGLHQTTTEAAQAVEDFGKKAEGAAEGSDRMLGSLGHLTTHIAGEAIPGMGRLARSIGSIGEAAVGAGPFLAAMVPIAALVAAVTIMDKLAEAANKDAKTFESLAIESGKMDDKLMEAKERFTELTQGPLAAANEKLTDFGKKTSEVSTILSKTDAVLAASTSMWDKWSAGVTVASQDVYAYLTGQADLYKGFAQSNTAIDTQVTKIATGLHTVDQMAEAVKKLKDLQAQVGSSGVAGPLQSEQVGAIQNRIDEITKAMELANQEHKNLAEQAHQDQLKASVATVTVKTGQIAQEKSQWDQLISNAESAAKKLHDIDQERIAAISNDKSVQGAGATTAAKQKENEDDLASTQNSIAVKKAAIQDESDFEISKLRETEQQKLTVLATITDPAARAKKRTEIEGETASQILSINSKLATDLNALSNQEAEAVSAYETKKTTITAEGVKARQEAELKAFEQYQSMLEAKEKADEHQIQQTLQLQLSAAKVQSVGPGGGGAPQQIKSEITAYQQAETAVQSLIAVESSRLATLQATRATLQTGTDEANAADKDIQALQDKLATQTLLYQQYYLHIQSLQQQQGMVAAQVLTGISNQVNQNVMQWMQGHETFGRMAQKMWLGIASAAISGLMRVAEQELIGLAVHSTVLKQEQLANAKAAASGAYKSVVGIPYVGPILAPIAAATAFAATAAFEQGGIVENTGGALVHKNEMVLPAHLSKFVQDAAAQRAGNETGAGGGDEHFHYSPTISINAIDKNGMEDALREHGEFQFSQWQQQMRDRNIF